MERENRGLSLKVISQHTKISVTMLQNLEEENFDMLPNKAYIKGFIKSVSKTLGLSESVALEIFEDTLRKREGLPKVEEKVEPVQTQATPAQSKPQAKPEGDSEADAEPVFKMGLVALAALVIIGFVVVVNTPSDKEAKEPKVVEAIPTPEATKTIMPQTLTADTPLRNENPIANVTPNAEATEEAVEATATPVATATTTPTPQPTATATPAPEPTKAAEENKEEKVEFKKFTRDLYAFETEGAEEALNQYVPEAYQGSVIQGKQNIFIKAVSGDTWLTYKSDGNPIKKFILKEGRHLIIRGDEIIIFLGNVKVTKIFLNNKLLKIQTRSGVKSLIFPQENKVNYRLPLFIYNNKKGTVMTSKEYLEENPEAKD
jgi:cytoskeleton protein RodZ